MKNSKLNTIQVLAILSFTLSGCSGTNDNSSKESSAKVKKQVDYAIYDGPNNSSDFEGKYHNNCTSSICVLEISPDNSPLKKNGGTPICLIPKYESKAVLSVAFDRDSNFIGVSCQISESDYADISSYYGINNIYNKYLDQRGVYEDFRNWKTSSGFITSYKELIGRGNDGRIGYSYNVYVGIKEHPHFSEFVKP
ncbi:hypothetical protein ACO0LG_01705 [Undibacterium sp. Ji42W]|uniref:hypothetical protein n=1 Tax=Undibacterium sp. Ji42W TaxID=3413039 RepID=UPI003BF3C2CE